MNDIHDENGQFKMRLDDEVEEDAPIPAQVDDMRMEKLNHKMTLISILIPVFLVVVLVIAYLDIKKRVVRTEDTGSIGVQTLSQDLDSRFSSLSLNQAKIVEDMARLSDQTSQSVAKVQVNLKKVEDNLAASLKPLASRKDMKAAAEKMDKKLANVSQSVEEVNSRVAEMAAMTQSLEAQMNPLRQDIVGNKKALASNKGLMTELTESVKGLDENKIDKEALDLAIKLEILRIKQSFRSQLDELEERLKKLESRSLSTPPAPPAAIPDTTVVPKPSQTEPAGKIEEQTIGR